MDNRVEAIRRAVLDAIWRGEPAATATGIEAGGSNPREIAARSLVELIAGRRRGS
jgi:hypothetical protein